MKVDTICAIDMGSRNFKFVTGQVVDGQLETKLMGKYEMALGKEVEKNHGVIGPDKLGEIEQVLRRLRDECQAESLKTIRAIATRAIRTAVNGGDVAKLALKLGIDVEIADGIREGEVGYLAATGGDDNRFVAELGSQSFQLAWNTGSGIESSSFPLGYEYIFHEYIQPACHLTDAEHKFRSFLEMNVKRFPRGADRFIAMAAKAIAGFVRGIPKQEVAGSYLDREMLGKKIRELRALSDYQFTQLKQDLDKPGKILAGIIFLDFIMEKTGFVRVMIQDAELPVGLIVEYFRNRADF